MKNHQNTSKINQKVENGQKMYFDQLSGKNTTIGRIKQNLALDCLDLSSG